MVYRNLTKEQFRVVKEMARIRLEEQGLKTIGDYKRVGNEIIDEIEAGTLSFADMYQLIGKDHIESKYAGPF